MKDWEQFFTEYPTRFGDQEYLKQVGATVGGQPISDWQFRQIISDICSLLEFQKDDVLLDLCCGNGLITKELAVKCQAVVGVDFSEPNLRVANRDHRPANVIYERMNVLRLQKVDHPKFSPFNKILMYAALQYFTKQDLVRILNNILQVSTPGSTVLLGGIPDREKKWEFYDTPWKRLALLTRTISGRERMGTWWNKETIRSTLDQMGLECEFHEQSDGIHTAHYRFDVTIII